MILFQDEIDPRGGVLYKLTLCVTLRGETMKNVKKSTNKSKNIIWLIVLVDYLYWTLYIKI